MNWSPSWLFCILQLYDEDRATPAQQEVCAGRCGLCKAYPKPHVNLKQQRGVSADSCQVCHGPPLSCESNTCLEPVLSAVGGEEWRETQCMHAALTHRPADDGGARVPTPSKTAPSPYGRHWAGNVADRQSYVNTTLQRQVSQHSGLGRREPRHPGPGSPVMANVPHYVAYGGGRRSARSPGQTYDPAHYSPAMALRYSPSPGARPVDAHYEMTSPRNSREQFALPHSRQLAAEAYATRAGPDLHPASCLYQHPALRQDYVYAVQAQLPPTMGSRSTSARTTTTATLSTGGFLPLTKSNLDQLAGGEASAHGPGMTLVRYIMEQCELRKHDSARAFLSEQGGGPVYPPHRATASPRRAPYYVPLQYAQAQAGGPNMSGLPRMATQGDTSPDDLIPRGGWMTR